MAQGNVAQALALFQEADRKQPTGMLQIRIHQAESALLGRDAPVDNLLEWLRREPSDTRVQNYTADAMVRTGRIEEAIALYEKSLRLFPEDFRLLNNIADALQRKGDLRALEYAQRAFQLQPTNATVLTTFGVSLLNSGKLVEAIQTLQKAVDAEPENSEARFQFARVLIAAGDRLRAKAELQRLLQANKDFQRKSDARRLLEGL